MAIKHVYYNHNTIDKHNSTWRARVLIRMYQFAGAIRSRHFWFTKVEKVEVLASFTVIHLRVVTINCIMTV